MLLVIVIIVFILFMVLEIRRELSTFKTVYYNIQVPGIKDERRIVFLSDLHNHVYGENNSQLFEAIADEEPDLILIGGDMLVGKENEHYTQALEFVKQLPEICPVYYANGNHEQRMKECPDNYIASYVKYQDELKERGVSFLENSSVEFLWDNREVRITGLEIPLKCYTHFRRVKLTDEEINERIGEKNPMEYNILLAHNPGYMKNYLEWGADLILSGHLHGGIVRIPGVTGVIAPNFEIFPKYSGDIYQDGMSDIVVSKGLGTHTFNIRLFNPAEVVVLCISEE